MSITYRVRALCIRYMLLAMLDKNDLHLSIGQAKEHMDS
jgi:hypothetical protein